MAVPETDVLGICVRLYVFSFHFDIFFGKNGSERSLKRSYGVCLIIVVQLVVAVVALRRSLMIGFDNAVSVVYLVDIRVLYLAVNSLFGSRILVPAHDLCHFLKAALCVEIDLACDFVSVGVPESDLYVLGSILALNSEAVDAPQLAVLVLGTPY